MHLVAKGTLAAGSHSVPGSCRWMLHRLHDAFSLKRQGSTREQQQVHGKCRDDREEQQRQQQWESHRHPHRHSQHTTRTTKGNRRVTAVLLVHEGAGLAGLGQRKTHLRTYERQRKQSWLSQRGRMLWEERLLARHLKRGRGGCRVNVSPFSRPKHRWQSSEVWGTVNCTEICKYMHRKSHILCWIQFNFQG